MTISQHTQQTAAAIWPRHVVTPQLLADAASDLRMAAVLAAYRASDLDDQAYLTWLADTAAALAQAGARFRIRH